MSYNSKAYLAYEERRLQPDTALIKGNHRWHQPIVIKHAKLPPPDLRNEDDIEKMEDEYLKKYNV